MSDIDVKQKVLYEDGAEMGPLVWQASYRGDSRKPRPLGLGKIWQDAVRNLLKTERKLYGAK
jgi:hypothetical protein